jgi:hypothetical protein
MHWSWEVASYLLGRDLCLLSYDRGGLGFGRVVELVVGIGFEGRGGRELLALCGLGILLLRGYIRRIQRQSIRDGWVVEVGMCMIAVVLETTRMKSVETEVVSGKSAAVVGEGRIEMCLLVDMFVRMRKVGGRLVSGRRVVVVVAEWETWMFVHFR